MILQKSRNRLFVCSELPDHRPAFERGALFLEVFAEEGHGLFGHCPGLLRQAIVGQAAEHHVVGDAPDGSLPVGRVVGGAHVER